MLNTSFSTEYNYRFFFSEGSNPFEFVLALSFMSTIFMLTGFVFTYLVCKRVPQSEKRSGFRHLLRANGVSSLAIALSNTTASALYVLLTCLVVFPVDFIWYLNPLVSSDAGLVWYTLMITASVATLSALSQILVTYSGPGITGMFIIVAHFVYTLVAKYVIFALALLPLGMPVFWMNAITETLILLSPENIAALWAENLLNRVFNASYALPEYGSGTNVVAFYEHFWACSPVRYLANMAFCHLVLMLIIVNEGLCIWSSLICLVHV